MQPYEFGYCVGMQLEKQALGPSLGGFNPLNQDNTLARTVGYFVPGLSSVQAGQDLYNNISQGNVLGSLGSAGMMALGLIPGAGLLGGAARGIAQGGKALMNGGRVAQAVGRGMQTVGAAGTQAARGMLSANRGATSLNTAMSQGIQKHIPIAQTSWKSVGPMSIPMNPVKSTMNAMIRNPINTVAMTTSSAPPQNTAAQIAAQQMAP
ncbi:MAG: hypothetical protein EBZ75_13585 [Oxalobacteraceae bacterium]|nr:hypothetical protein [Oxalobacteraceae bacterium]